MHTFLYSGAYDDGMFFIGIDLAWSKKNASGIAIIKGTKTKGKLIHTSVQHSLDSMIEVIGRHSGFKDAIIAVDAPLTVPNEEGCREAERSLRKVFHKYNAGAHPSNRTRLGSWNDMIPRGEELVRILEKHGFREDPYIERYEPAKKIIEVFPHPSQVTLFNLKKILPYKAKPKRDYAFRHEVFKTYQKHLNDLEHKRPSLTFPDPALLDVDVTLLKGKALKEYEDLLDGIFCAYLAHYIWANPEKCKIFGTVEGGHIITPIPKI